MGVTVSNLIMGPGTLYYGTFGAAEPADAQINTTPAASAWTDTGATDGGLAISVAQTLTMLACDQVIDTVGRRLTARDITLTTSLAEPTLANLALSLNSTIGATGANYATYEPAYSGPSASQLPYNALIVDGFAPAVVANARRRIVMRRVLSDTKVDFSYDKAKQTLLSVTFAAHYVSNSIAPIHICDQTA
jgi:hypothetical protein